VVLTCEFEGIFISFAIFQWRDTPLADKVNSENGWVFQSRVPEYSGIGGAGQLPVVNGD
jgi:hypothetical protein